jgi:hypothetical protein
MLNAPIFESETQEMCSVTGEIWTEQKGGRITTVIDIDFSLSKNN